MLECKVCWKLQSIFCFTLILSTGSWCFADDFDARCTGMKFPSKVAAHQVFEVHITFKNTGNKAWGDGMKLRSQDPLDNETWGTSFIYMGQGRKCSAGDEITFRSFLKAPGRPGRYTFQWRLARNRDNLLVGESTKQEKIMVVQRATGPQKKQYTRDTSGKRVLALKDFSYVGSFKIPDKVDDCGAAYTESGLALRISGDGTKRLFIRIGLRKSIIYEASIPVPVRLENHNHASLEVAQVRKVWGELKLPGEKGESIEANAGFWWNEAKRILYWSYYHGYTTGRPPVLGASRLIEGKENVHYGPWRIPESVKWFKSYWGGVTGLSHSFAEKYTGGRKMALGFGGYYSICAPASRGPALAAISEPDPHSEAVDLLEMLAYPWSKEASAPRDGDYFVANCSWGGRPPEDSGKGYWTMDDWVRAGVFIDLPEVHGFLALAVLGTGRIGYDYGAIRSAGRACCWYFYDPRDLGAVALGNRKPWEIMPHSIARINYPSGIRPDTRWGAVAGEATGACFDNDARILYVYHRFCIDNNARELFPCVHAYKVK